MSPEPDDPSEQVDPGGRDQPLNVDAHFAEIVAHYGDEPEDPVRPAEPPRMPGAAPGIAERFSARGWSEQEQPTEPAGWEALNTPATWEDEGHFVPPDPPPIAVPEPRRLLAWTGVLGAPVVMLILVAMRAVPPAELTFLLVVAFVSGFIYLVATMDRRTDQWPGDDGAVL